MRMLSDARSDRRGDAGRRRGRQRAPSVEVKDAVARVTVIPENRADIKVEVIQANPQLPLEVRTFAGRTIVDGRLGRRIRDCHGSGENVSVRVARRSATSPGATCRRS